MSRESRLLADANVCRRGHSLEDAYERPDGKGRQCRKCARIREGR